jgi:RNA recognition motif-containing protein
MTYIFTESFECRGFAFVDFLSHQEAVDAMEAVAGTHLYGRRLVAEWADQDEGLDELRAKTAAKFHEWKIQVQSLGLVAGASACWLEVTVYMQLRRRNLCRG